MSLELLDWVVVFGYLLISIGIGIFVVKHDSKNITDFLWPVGTCLGGY